MMQVVTACFHSILGEKEGKNKQMSTARNTVGKQEHGLRLSESYKPTVPENTLRMNACQVPFLICVLTP